MKAKKFFKNLIIYVGAFLAVVTLTAGFKVGSFFIGKASSGGKADTEEGGSTPNLQDSALTKVLDNMLTKDKANFNLNLAMESEESSPITLSSDIYLSMPTVSTMALEETESESLKVSFKGNFKFNNQTINYDINYLNGFIYANIGDVKLKIETENMMGDLSTILDFAFLKKFGVNITLPDLSQIEFGPELLNSLASQLTETETDTGKEIKFNVLGYGWITLQTDAEYGLQNIVLDGFEFGGTRLTADVIANLSPLPQEIVEPANKNDMTDLTGLTNFLKVVDSLITKGSVGGNATVNIMDKQLNAEYNVNFEDFNNLKIYLKTEFVNNDFEFIFQNNNAYITYADCKYSFVSPFDFTEITDALEFYAEKFGLELPQGDFSSVLDLIDINDLNKLLQSISNLKVDETGLNYSYKDITLNLSVNNNEFDKITANFKDIVSLDIDLNSEVEIPQVVESDYKNMLDENLFNLLNKQLIVNKNLSLQAQIKIKDINIDASLKVDFKDQTKVQLQLNVFNRNILLTILDTKVYLEVDNILKANGTFEELINFVKSLDLFDFETTQIDFNQVLQLVLDFLDNDNVVLTLIKQSGNVEAFEVIEPNVHCTIHAVEYEDIDYTENGEYINLVDLGSFAKTLIETLVDSPLAFNISATLGEYAISGKVQYVDGKLSAILSTTILDKNLTIEIDNTDLFVNFDGLKIKASLDDLTEILTFIAPKLEFDLTELENIDIDEMLAKLTLCMANDKLNVNFGDIAIQISCNPVQAVITYNDIQATLTLGKTFETTQKQGYLDFANLKQLIKATVNSVETQAVSGKINLTFNLFDSEQTLAIDYKFEVDEQSNILAYISTTFKGINLNAYIVNNDIYFEVFNIKVHFNLTQIPDIINWLNTVFKTNISSNLSDYVSLDDLKNMSFDIISALSSTENSTTITLNNGYTIVVSFEDTIQSISVTNTEFSVQVLCNSFETFTFDTLKASDYKDSNLLTNKQFALQLSTEIFGQTIAINLTADLTESIKIQLSTTLFNQNIQIVVIDENVYLEIGSIFKTKTTITALVNYIKNLNLDLVNNFDVSQMGEILALIENQELKVENNEGVVKVSYQDYFVNIKSIEFAPISYTESGNYINLVELIDFAKNIYDQLNSTPLAFNVNATLGEYTISGKVQYVDDTLSAILSTTILDKNLIIEVENTDIFVNFDGLKIKCNFDDILEIIEYIQTNTTFINQDLSLDINPDDILDNLVIAFNNSVLTLTYQNITAEISASPIKIEFNMDSIAGTVTLTEQFSLTEKVGYFDFGEMKDLFKATINTIKNKSISGEVDITLNLFGEDNQLKINYSVAFENNKIIGYISTTFKGLNINAYFDGENIFLDIVGFKTYINLNQIDDIIAWINSTFNAQISSDFTQYLDIDKLTEMSFDIIKNITNTENNTIVELTNGLTLEVQYTDVVNKVIFSQNSNLATLTCTNFDSITLDKLNKQEFKEYLVFTNLIDTTINFINSKQYNISAEINKFVESVLSSTYSATMQLDIVSGLNAYVDILGLGEQITVGYQDKLLYLCYGGENGLKLSIQENAIQEILGIVFSAMNIDTSKIPFLDEFLQKDDIDTGNLETIIPEIDFGNPLQYLEYINAFNITDTYFEVTLKAEKLGEYAHGKDIAIRLNFVNKQITDIQVTNLYLGSADEFVNISILLNDFNGVQEITEKEKYIDLSGAKDLLRAFVNTSNLTDWHITGKVQLDLALGSLKINAAELDVDIQVQLDDSKQPIIAVELSSYPLIAGVNNKNTNGVGAIGVLERHRTMSIYFKDGELYLKTKDAKYGAYKELTRTTKITPQYLVENLSYYMQYLLGFTDTIQTKIDEAIEKSMSYTGATDYGNIILSYTHVDNSHTLVLNMAEIAHNDDIGLLTLGLTTINNESTQNKDFLYRIDLDIKMLDDMLALKTDSSKDGQGLFLTNIGEKVDVSKVDEIETLYKENGFALYGEYEKEGSKDWEKANTGTTEITYISQGETLSTSSGEVATIITFPQMSNFLLDDHENGTQTEYTFAGWFYDETFTMPFTATTYPSYNTILYAKWEIVEVKTYAVIEFVTDIEQVEINSYTAFIGDNLVLPTCQNIVEQVDDHTTILKTFIGWFTESGEQYTSQQYEFKHLVLTARWSEKVTKVYDVLVYYNESVVYQNTLEENTVLNLSGLNDYNQNTLIYTTSTFDENTIVTDLTITSNLTLYLRNKFNVTINSAYTTIDGGAYHTEQELYEHSTITLPWYANYTTDNGSYTTEYVFLGYNLNGQLITDSTALTPNGDCTYEANWQVTEYCIVTFDICFYNPSWWVESGKVTQNSISQYVTNTNDTNQVKIERNTALEFSNYVVYANYTYKWIFSAKYDYKSVAWAEQGNNVSSYDGDTSLVITGNCTLEPIWVSC